MKIGCKSDDPVVLLPDRRRPSPLPVRRANRQGRDQPAGASDEDMLASVSRAIASDCDGDISF